MVEERHLSRILARFSRVTTHHSLGSLAQFLYVVDFVIACRDALGGQGLTNATVQVVKA
jgi:hypothetical protein